MATETATKTSIPYHWMTPEQKEKHMLLCYNCFYRTCPSHKSKRRYYQGQYEGGRWTAWQIPARTIRAWGSTFRFEEGCNVQRAFLLRAIAREHRRKASTVSVAPLPLFIEQVRTGSHREIEKWVDPSGRKHQYSRILPEYRTIYHDSLVTGDWLKEHEHDHDGFKPTMEINVNGKTLSLNGNLKKNMIRDFMKANK